MPGILIIAHAPLASALCACAVHVFGRQPQRLETLDVDSAADPQQLLQQAGAAVERLAGEDREVLVLADTAGATPCNAACRLLAATGTSARVRLLGGVNLPMLLRALCYQHEALEQLVARALEGGRRAIVEIDALAAASATTGCAQHPSCPESNC